MSLALNIPDVAPSLGQAHTPYRLSGNELRLRSQFVAAFTDGPRSASEMQTAVWELTDQLKVSGELAEGVVKRIKYIAALPISFHYRAGYKPAHSRLMDSVNEAISLSIARYFADKSERTARTLARGTLTCAARTTALLAFIASAVQASAQDLVSERRIESLVAAGVRGEIDYNFDTTLNRTSARYKTSLGSANFIKRLLSSPEVHTLIATYEFGGKSNAALPDVVQLAFLSDEYIDGLANAPQASWPSPLLIMRIGESVMRIPLGIAQRTEVWSGSGSERQTAVHSSGPTSLINMNAARNQVHRERTAIAWIRFCDFLSIVNGRDVSGTVAGLDFDVNDEVLAGLRQFTAEMSPRGTESSKTSCTRNGLEAVSQSRAK